MENLDSVKNRLLAYLKANRITQAEFSRMTDVSSSYVSAMRESMSLDMQKKVKEAFPDLNMQWLIYCEGDMVIQGDNSISVGRDNNGSINSCA